MPILIFIDPAGVEHRVEAEVGQSVMQAAVGALVPGIEAACGGNCVCATCHSYIEQARFADLTPADEMEREMIACTPLPEANSRLTCQLRVTQTMDGLRLQVPASQH